MKQTRAKVFTAASGVPWYVRVIEQGERYGAAVNIKVDGVNWRIPDAAAEWDSEKPGVIFYDFRHVSEGFSPRGQQVSTYYIETILAGENCGLDLMGYEPSWKIDAETMEDVRHFLRVHVAEKRTAGQFGDIPKFITVYETKEQNNANS